MNRLALPFTTALLILALPLVANDFFLVQIGAQTAILGLIALSTMFLGGWASIVSLSQLTVAGIAGYTLALSGTSSVSQSLGLGHWFAIPAALITATLFGLGIGLLAGRTRGIHTIMITLAIGVATYYFANQNYSIFNGFTGYSSLNAPVIFGYDMREPTAFFWLCAGLAFLGWGAVQMIGKATFGKALVASRDEERRLAALGYDVAKLRLIAHCIAALLAATGGVLLAWYNGRISPGTIAVGPMIDILVITVIGGMARPVGPFVGALLFVMLQTFAIDIVNPERFNTLIGFTFLVIVLASPDGITSLWYKRAKTRS